MKRICVLILMASLTTFSCASIAVHQRVARFDETAEAFRHTLLASDFAGTSRFVDPERPNGSDAQNNKLVRVVDYQVTHVDVSDDHCMIEQDVTVQYYHLNINRLQTVRCHQVWMYNDVHKIWLLQTDLPAFN